MPILSILIGLVIICLLYWAVTTLMGAFGIGPPVSVVIQVVFVVLIVLWLVSLIGGGMGFGSFGAFGHTTIR